MKKSIRRTRRKTAATYQVLESKNMLASVGFDGAGQGSAELTYYLGAAPAEVGQAQFESTIQDALKVWSDVADITFTETARPGLRDSLDITFERIDGAGGTLARAYFPDDMNPARIAGDIQFDSADRWEVGNAQGNRAFDLLHVAVHEIGHALGLPHDTAFGAVLAPTVSPNTAFVALGQSDIDAILELYAPAEPALVSPPVLPPTFDPAPVTPEDPVVNTPDTQTPDQQTPTDPDQQDDEDEEETEPTNNDDDDSEEVDPAEEFRRRLQRFINQWLRRLRQYGFRFRFR